MKIQLHASTILVALVLSLSLISATYAETYSYDSAGRLIGVVYDDDSSVSYNYDANGNLLALTSEPSILPPANEAPSVNIVGGNGTIADTDEAAGESVSLSATATDSDGTIATTQWLINSTVVATGLTPDITFPDGQTVITFKAVDNDGDASTDTVTITVTAPPLEEGWPVPYSGITPDESLGLDFNNISALNPQDGLIYSCIRIFSNGIQSTLEGIDRFDIAFQIVSATEATIGVVRVKPFNGTGALNEFGELPDCSGAIELTTGIYTDFIQAGNDLYGVEFVLFDSINLLFRVNEIELIGTIPPE